MSQQTSDRWSMERTRAVGDLVFHFRPYAALRCFAVFLWTDGRCETLYDGEDIGLAEHFFGEPLRQHFEGLSN